MKPNLILKSKKTSGIPTISIVKAIGFAFLGIYFIYIQFWIGLTILILALPFLYITNGVIFQEKSYYEFTSVFGFKFGKHKPIPPILYVLVRDIRFVSEGGENGEEIVHEMYEVALVCAPRQKIVLQHTNGEYDTITTAKNAIEYFNCELKDTTFHQIMTPKKKSSSTHKRPDQNTNSRI